MTSLVARIDPPAVKPKSAVKPSAPNTGVKIAQVLVLVLLLVGPGLVCIHAANVNDPDIWWHLRTGEWIQQHHAVPHEDPFSGQNAGKAWQAYSWMFELLVFRLFQRFGLVGIAGYSAVMILAITTAMWHLVKRLQTDVLVVAGIVFTTCISFRHLFTPRPWLFTILFFVLELDILMRVRKTERYRELLWLPVIFALWSNIHIQFIDGLLVLGLAAVESLLAKCGIGEKTSLCTSAVWAALLASVAATLVNPYGWRIYQVGYDLVSQAGVLDKIKELQANPFRDLVDFLVLFLTVAATAALFWDKRFRVFEAGLLLFGVVVSFRSQRDVWVIGTAAAAILAENVRTRQSSAPAMPRFASAVAACVAAVLLFLSFPVMHIDNNFLAKQIHETLPVDAVNNIRMEGYRGPLYNDFDWGGYLMWALRMPLAIDGRAALYGDQAIDRSVATWNGQPDWAFDPELKSAGIVIGPVKSPLIQLLRMDQQFRLVYEDKLAAVFVPRK